MKNNSIKICLFSVIIACLGLSCSHSVKEDSKNPYHLKIVQSIAEYRAQVKANPQMELVNIKNAVNDVVLDIRYATDNNFTKHVIYTAPMAYARKPVVEALKHIRDSLAFHNLGLKIYDAYRPYAATLHFYEVYPDTNFVANPRFGSRHNRGCAVDLTLIDKRTGEEIPMPSGFDDFSDKALPGYANLPDTVIADRAFLLSVMTHFGFTRYPTEWWHFDYNGWKNFPLMDLSFDELQKQAE